MEESGVGRRSMTTRWRRAVPIAASGPYIQANSAIRTYGGVRNADSCAKTPILTASRRDRRRRRDPIASGWARVCAPISLAGMLVTAPISITIYIAWGFISFVDRQVIPLLPDRYNPENYLPFTFPASVC